MSCEHCVCVGSDLPAGKGFVLTEQTFHTDASDNFFEADGQ